MSYQTTSNTTPIISHHKEYTSLNSGAHRKPAARIGAPGLCRQINFWIPDYLRPGAKDSGHTYPIEKAYALRREEWIHNIDEFIANIFGRIISVDRSFIHSLKTSTFNHYGEDQDTNLYLFQHTLVRLPLVSMPRRWELRPLFPAGAAELTFREKTYFRQAYDLTVGEIPARFQLVYFRFSWQGIPVRMRFTLDEEYFSVGIYMDIIDTTNASSSQKLAKSISEHFDEVNTICASRYACAKSGVYHDWPKHVIDDLPGLRPAHNFLYAGVWEEFEAEILSYGYGIEGGDATLRSSIGSIVYDARGVLLHCPPDDPHGRLFSAPFRTPENLPLREHIAHPHDFKDTLTAVNYTETALPFIAAHSPGGEPSLEYDERVEYTVSKFLRGRVIYVSSLAAEHVGAGHTTTPLKFLILCRPFHRWQLGRLVDRLFELGSARVAAMINIGTLNEAGEALQEISRDLRQTLTDVTAVGPHAPSARESLATKLADLRRRTANLGNTCDGGLEYRIDRSRYYVRLFRAIEDTLHMEFVEGFQRYDIFIRRKFQASYDFIHSLGLAIERHKRDLEWLGQQVQIQQHLSTNRKSQTIQQKLLELQIAAELAVTVPMTYYLLGVWRELDQRSMEWYKYGLALVPALVLCLLAIRHLRRYVKWRDPDQLQEW